MLSNPTPFRLAGYKSDVSPAHKRLMSKPRDALRVFHQAYHQPSNSLRSRLLLRATPSRCLATVHTGRSLPSIWFKGSAPSSLPSIHDQGHHKPPDKRTLQLGKSKIYFRQTSCANTHLVLTFLLYSIANPARTTANPSSISTAIRDLITTHHASPFPFHPSTFADCFWPSCVCSGALDQPDSMGPSPDCWKCKVGNSL